MTFHIIILMGIKELFQEISGQIAINVRHILWETRSLKAAYKTGYFSMYVDALKAIESPSQEVTDLLEKIRLGS